MGIVSTAFPQQGAVVMLSLAARASTRASACKGPLNLVIDR
jgi:hypothetical protein